MVGLLWVFFEKVGLTLLSILATFWYAVILGPDGFGFAAILLSVSLLVSGVQDSIQQAPLLSAEKGDYDVYAVSLKGWLFLSLLTSTVLFLLLVSVYGVEYWGIILFSVLHIPVSSVSRVFVADLLKRQEYRKLALRAFLGKILGVSIGLALAFFGYVKLAIILQSFVALAVALVVMIKQSEILSALRPHIFSTINYKLFKRLFVEGIPSGVNVLEQSAKNHGLIIFLGLFVGNAASGLYSLAIKFVDIPRVLIGFGFSSWAVGKFHSAKEDSVKLLGLYTISSSWAAMVLAPCYFGIMSVAEPLITEFFGAEWTSAANVLCWLALYHCIMSIFLLLPPLQVLFKRTYNTLLISSLSTIVILLSVVLFSSSLGIYSPIAGMFISILLVFPKYTSELNDILRAPKGYIASCFIGFFSCAALMAATVKYSEGLFDLDNLYLLIAIGALSYALYLSILFLIYRKSFKDIVRIRGL